MSSIEMLRKVPHLLDYPIAPPPPGVVPNFAHPEDRRYQVYVAAGICLGVIVLFAAARLYAKLAVLKKRTKDDYAYIVALSSGIVFFAIIIALGANRGYGEHEYDRTIGTLTLDMLRLSQVVELIYNPCIFCIKATLFLFYLELFGRLRWLRYLAWFGLVLNGLFYLACTIAFAVISTPRTGLSQLDYFAMFISESAAQQRSLSMVIAAVNAVSDFYLLILPLPAVWGLQLPRRKKIGISAIVFTGLM